MTELTPPLPNVDPPRSTNGMKQMGIIMILLAAVALLIGILIASRDDSSAPAATNAPVQTYAPAPVVNKYEAYLNHVYNNSGQANSINKSDLIGYGDTICSALDNGRTIPYIVSYLSDNSSGETDAALYASVIFGAITYICDEYKGDLNLYLSNSN